MKLLRTSLLAVTAALAGVVLAAAPAQAAADDLPTLKAALTARIDLRLAALAKDTAAVTAAKHLADADTSTLTSLIGADTTAMNSLKTKVAGETTATALKADATSVVDDYRIFILVGPKVRLAIAGDAEQAAIAKLQTVHDKLADMAAAIGKAKTDSAGQVAAVLAIQPGPDGAAIKTRVAGVRQATGTTRADLKTAVADAKKVTVFLKSLKTN